MSKRLSVSGEFPCATLAYRPSAYIATSVVWSTSSC